MANISLGCLKSIMEASVTLGQLGPYMIVSSSTSQAVSSTSLTLDNVEGAIRDVLGNCPHPSDVVSDAGAPRTFMRQLRALKEDWQDQGVWSNVEALEDLQDTLYRWLEGMMGPDVYPEASFWGGGVPGTIPTGEPTWMADPYQMDTSGQFIRKYPSPSAWRSKKARTRVVNQKMIGAKP